MFSVSLSLPLSRSLFWKELQGANESTEERAVTRHWIWKISLPFFMIYFSPGLCVELYSHHLLCCREKKGLCWIVFGRAYHWLISFISKLSTSTDVAVLVNFIPSWQHTRRKRPSLSFFVVCLSQSRQSVIQHSYFRFDYTLYNVTEWSGKQMMNRWWKEHSINIQTSVFA